MDAPRGLYDRLRYVADIVRDAGKVASETLLLYRACDGKVCAVPIGGELSVGRDLPSSHVINDAKLSRRHWCIFKRGERAILCDLKSRNGTYVNGERIKERELRDGDIIEAGSQVFVFLKGDCRVESRTCPPQAD